MKFCKCGAVLELWYYQKIAYYNQKIDSYKNNNKLVCSRCGEKLESYFPLNTYGYDEKYVKTIPPYSQLVKYKLDKEKIRTKQKTVL